MTLLPAIGKLIVSFFLRLFYLAKIVTIYSSGTYVVLLRRTRASVVDVCAVLSMFVHYSVFSINSRVYSVMLIRFVYFRSLL